MGDSIRARQELLELRLRKRSSRAPPLSAPPRASADTVRLSYQQEGLWFLEELTGRGDAYHMAFAAHLRGALDATLLEASLRVLVRRHESLRTAIGPADGGPAQTVLPADLAASRVSLEILALESAALDGQLDALVAKPFDLGRAPLLRATLLALGPDHHVLVVVTHHIIFDGWSMSILLRELGALYAAGGDAAALPPLAARFADFAVLQRDPIGFLKRETQLAYWRSQLRGVETLQLPVDRVRPAHRSSSGATLRFTIEPPQVTALRTLALGHGATMFMVLLAAFQAFLARITGQSDIAVGVPIAGRSGAELEGVIGYFVNTLVMRSDLGGEPTFTELLERVRGTVLDAFAHQDLPFDQLVADLNPDRDLRLNPLYQVAFAFSNQPASTLDLPGLASERILLTPKTAKFDLTLNLTEVGDGLAGEIELADDIFDRATVERIAASFQTLLGSIAADPESLAPIDRLPLLDPATRHEILVDWNATDRDYPLDRSYPALFQDQARRTPAAVALAAGDRTMTYGELQTRASRLAGRLRAVGVGPNVIVGVCMDRALELPVALLAILEAGGAFLPLDPDVPDARLAYMATDAQAPILLTQPHLTERIAGWDLPPPFARLVSVPDGGSWPGDEGVAPSSSAASPGPEDPAYVLYTSGSTGRPKGVLVPHRALANHELWIVDELGLGPSDKWLQKTSLGFDAVLPELFAPLLAGGIVVFAPPGAQREPARILREVRDHGITIIQWGPGELRVILEEPGLRACNSVRQVISGGEALDRPLAEAFQKALPSARLGNFYGPTETAVDAAFYQLGAELPARPTVPIGRPVGNGELYVLDRHLEPVPIGVAGELYVGGAGLALGYLGRPELTAERFVEHPFRPGARLYRTGDLVRQDALGNVEYVGRIDRQVKLRGYRIELEEIEALLNGCTGVRGSAVVVHEDRGTKLLVGYVVSDEPDTSVLLPQLRERLPEYMIPAALIALPELPLTTSGKLDRAALPPPDLGATRRTEYVAPRSPVEATIAEIWRGVLGVERVGAHDDFFSLGGHSLSATQVMARIRAHFKVELPLRVLFEDPTPAALADALTAAQPDTGTSHAPVVRVSREDPAIVSYSQRRMWLLHALDPEGAAYNMRLAIRLEGPLNRTCLVAALERVAAHHEAFRTTFKMDADEPVAIVAPRAPRVPVEELDLRTTPDAENTGRLADELRAISARPFDLASGPLHRVALVRLEDDVHVLLLVMHHVIGDDWSFGIVKRDLETVYNALLLRREPELPSHPIEYVDYAAWQRRVLGQAELAPQVSYWLGKLAGLAPLDLPQDSLVLRRESSRGAIVTRPLTGPRLQRIRAFASEHAVSPYMVTLAAFQWLLSRYCRQTDIAVGSPIANRTQVEAEHVVGSLVNTLVLRTDLDGVETFADVLARTRETALGAFGHQDVPYDYLVEQLRAASPTSKVPEVRVQFNVLNTPSDDLRLENLTSTFLAVDSGSIQFDLSLHLDTEVERSALVTYSTELFDRITIERLVDNYLALLDRVLDAPDEPLAAEGLASPDELDAIAHFNATVAANGLDRTLPSLLAATAARSPRAIAVLATGERPLDYQRFHEAVNRWTRMLRKRGVRRGDLVGIYVERGIPMVVAQQAVLAAGAAYVPLDPAYPVDRLRYMVEDARLALLVTQSSLAGVLGWPRDRTLLLDVDQPWVDDEPSTSLAPDPALDPRPEDPAYVIYTSGSTGKPKGVVVHHRAVVNFLESMAKVPGLRPTDRLLAVTTLSFDIAVLELLLPVFVGASIVLATREEATDGVTLRHLLEEHAATILQATPATWRMLVEAGFHGPPGFKGLIGGEGLPLDLARELCGGRVAELWNMYGPTETTVWSTCWRVDRPETGISIGFPIDNTQIHVLDPAGHPCPIGVAGEIFIGGDGVTLGYLHREELTRERFVTDRFRRAGARDNAKIYRTGDRGRWRHDGRLEHMGRLDFQVKVRGHRIELGEIETALTTHEGVGRAIVIVREDRPGDVRLVAYVVAREPGAAAPAARDLREHLRSTLPVYMVPQHFVELAEVPLLPNGKIDRGRLPIPTDVQAAADADVAPPQSEAEKLLAAVWQELLGVAHVATTDNFFDLGGHSLLAMRAIAEIDRRIGVRFEPRRFIFESLGQMAASIKLGGNQ